MFNTGAPAEHFGRQLALLRRIIATGIDVYCYATFTTPTLPASPADAMRRFVDDLQGIDEHLPLRLIPLEVSVFSPVHPRLLPLHADSLKLQEYMVAAWQAVLAERFTVCNAPWQSPIYLSQVAQTSVGANDDDRCSY